MMKNPIFYLENGVDLYTSSTYTRVKYGMLQSLFELID